jgi:hypothetical protein
MRSRHARTLNAIGPGLFPVDEMLDKATKAEPTGTWAETSLSIVQTERGQANGLPPVLQEGKEAFAFVLNEGRIYGHEPSSTAGCDLAWYAVIVVAWSNS